jgi:hypothetical protein
MNIDELIEDLKTSNGIRKGTFRKRECDDEKDLKDNRGIKKYVTSEEFGKVFNSMVKFLEPIKNSLGRKYVRLYVAVPEGCQNHILTFAPSKTSNFNEGWLADNTRWIARMQLKKNTHSVLIYFPKEIVIPNIGKFKYENPTDKNTGKICEYEILKQEAIEEFIKNPEDFLCMKKIENRLNRV